MAFGGASKRLKFAIGRCHPDIALDTYNTNAIIWHMDWEVEFTNEFETWWNTLTEDEQEDVAASVNLLRITGPFLGRPHSDTLKNSRHANMKELRTQHRGRPLRTLYAFDPRRCAILLIGGDKTGDDRFYERMIPLADKLYTGTFSNSERRV